MNHDFIKHYPAVIDRRTCAAAIATMESQRFLPMKVYDRTSYGQAQQHVVDDRHFDMKNVEPTFASEMIADIFSTFSTDLPQVVESKVQEYMDEFSISHHHNGELRNLYFKMQMSDVGQSYSVWHSEWGANTPDRFLVWMLYLNDVFEGGETEWFYYPRRIQPRAGDLVIWPAHFAHAHRGNPPLDKKKYVVTGWITSN